MNVKRCSWRLNWLHVFAGALLLGSPLRPRQILPWRPLGELYEPRQRGRPDYHKGSRFKLDLKIFKVYLEYFWINSLSWFIFECHLDLKVVLETATRWGLLREHPLGGGCQSKISTWRCRDSLRLWALVYADTCCFRLEFSSRTDQEEVYATRL